MSNAALDGMHSFITTRISRTGIGLASALALAMVTSACGDNNSPDIDVDEPAQQGQQRGETIATQVETDVANDTPEIVLGTIGQIMLTIDEGEIMQAQLIVDRSEDEDIDDQVVDYANRMLDEHTAHMSQMMLLLDANEAAPLENAVSTQLRSEAQTGMRELENAEGNDLDRVYMRMQILMHSQSLVIVRTLEELAPEDEVRTFFGDTVQIIEDHRDEAQDILRDL